MTPIDFLLMTPPYCPTPECYVHGVPEQEHHVEGCPMYDTIGQASHRLDHAFRELGKALLPATLQLVEFTRALPRRWRLFALFHVPTRWWF